MVPDETKARYSGALAEHFRAHVIGLDPSGKMLAEASGKIAARSDTYALARSRYRSGKGQ
jgi:hypothetical protein